MVSLCRVIGSTCYKLNNGTVVMNLREPAFDRNEHKNLVHMNEQTNVKRSFFPLNQNVG